MAHNKQFLGLAALIAALVWGGHAWAEDTLSLDEVKTAAAAKFDKLDKDADGTLDSAEMKDLVGDRGFKTADADSDGSLDKKEFLAFAEKLFKRADVDHDGTVSTGELNGPNGKMLKRIIR